jgi:hypothetical protein
VRSSPGDFGGSACCFPTVKTIRTGGRGSWRLRKSFHGWAGLRALSCGRTCAGLLAASTRCAQRRKSLSAFNRTRSCQVRRRRPRIRARDADHPHRLCGRFGPCRRRLRYELASPRWKYHRLYKHGSGNGWQVAGVAHGDCAGRKTGRSHVQSRHGTRWRIILLACVRGGRPLGRAPTEDLEVVGPIELDAPFVRRPSQAQRLDL